jgi:hypothetical protein
VETSARVLKTLIVYNCLHPIIIIEIKQQIKQEIKQQIKEEIKQEIKEETNKKNLPINYRIYC